MRMLRANWKERKGLIGPLDWVSSLIDSPLLIDSPHLNLIDSPQILNADLHLAAESTSPPHDPNNRTTLDQTLGCQSALFEGHFSRLFLANFNHSFI